MIIDAVGTSLEMPRFYVAYSLMLLTRTCVTQKIPCLLLALICFAFALACCLRDNDNVDVLLLRLRDQHLLSRSIAQSCMLICAYLHDWSLTNIIKLQRFVSL